MQLTLKKVLNKPLDFQALQEGVKEIKVEISKGWKYHH